MNVPESIGAAKAAISNFLITDGLSLPEQTRQRIIDALSEPSPVDTIMTTLEALYADRDTISDAAKTLTAELASFAWPTGWHGIQKDNRGQRIIGAMMREIGESPPEGVEWPASSTDPDTAKRFLPQDPIPGIPPQLLPPAP